MMGEVEVHTYVQYRSIYSMGKDSCEPSIRQLVFNMKLLCSVCMLSLSPHVLSPKFFGTL